MYRLAFFLFGLLVATAHADQRDPRLDALFDRLRTASDVAAAETVEAQIWEVWSEAPDPGSAALLAAGTAAMGQRAWPRALQLFDVLVAGQPEFAEAWNKRATLLYLMGEHARSVADIQKTLALEPRHFGALSGLGLIFMATGDPDAALRSFEAVLAIYPLSRSARQQVETLRQQVEGEPL
jgi:tetratricopeptide (TPR) repeat protein